MALLCSQPYDKCEWCGGNVIDSEMAEEGLCQRCAQRFINMSIRESSASAKALRAIPSEKRSEASRQNGKKGGRPRKTR